MADTNDVENALLTHLLADTGSGGLLTLMPDGVFWDEANAGARRFVIVSLLDHSDGPMMGGRAYEDGLYLVKAVALSSTGANIADAAARIDTLLEGQTFAIDGYRVMTLHREARVRITEVDDQEPSIRWLHRGGHYRLMVSATAEGESSQPWIQTSGWVQV